MKKSRNLFVRAAMNILTSGDVTLFELGQRSRVIFLNAVTIAGAVMISLFAVIGFLSGNVPLGLACAVAALIVSINFLSIRLFRRYMLGGIVDCLVIFIFYYYLVLSGGEAGSGVLWINTYPLITLFLLGSVAGSVVALTFGVAVAVAVFVPALNAAAFSPLYSARVIGTYFFIWLFSFIYEVVRKLTLSRLEDSNSRLAKTSDALQAEKKQTDDILSGVQEGIFLLNRDYCLGDVHSAYLSGIFEQEDLPGSSLLDLLRSHLPEQDLTATADFLEMLFGSTVNSELLREINPLSEIRCTYSGEGGLVRGKMLRFTFARINAPDSPYPVLGVVSDVTSEYELKQQLTVEERKHKQSMENLFRIIHVDPLMMREFISDTEAELEHANTLMKTEGVPGEEILATLGTSSHAIKGNALLLGLDEFASKVHAYEDSIKEIRTKGHSWRDLLALTVGLGDIRTDLEELNTLISRIEKFQLNTAARASGANSLLQLSLDKFIRKESERLELPVHLQFQSDEDALLSDEYRKLVKDVLVQLVRNSFAHGIEAAERRQAKGKNPEASISIRLENNDDELLIHYRDDGAGLDLAGIRRRAAQLPLLAERAAGLNEAELVRLIFMPGFSTAVNAGMEAGRGEGMALVRSRVQEAGGKLALKNNPGQYLEWTIRLPGTGSSAAAIA
ncbi:MAG: hypothetical protein KKI09_08330 [Spirochaetes bacterium]|nr:hypothetical protein [Spirochaetota bacterium]MBU0955418.1 hypothetical protein [Spirochaetota bacterium]